MLLVTTLAFAARPADSEVIECVRAYEMVEADLAAYALLRSQDPMIRAVADRIVDDDLALVRAIHERVREANLPRADNPAAATIRANGEALLTNLRAQPADRFDEAFLTSLAGVDHAAILDIDTWRDRPVTSATQTFLLNVGTSFEIHRDQAWAELTRMDDLGMLEQS